MQQKISREYTVELEDSLTVTPLRDARSISIDVEAAGQELQLVIPVDRQDEFMVDLTQACERLIAMLAKRTRAAPGELAAKRMEAAK